MQHVFFQGEMSKRLALELLQKVSNPPTPFADAEPDEDGTVPNVPHRIASRQTAKPRPKSPTSLLDSEGNFKLSTRMLKKKKNIYSFCKCFMLLQIDSIWMMGRFKEIRHRLRLIIIQHGI